MFEERPTQWIQLTGSLLSALFALIIFGFLANRRRKKRGEDTKSLGFIEIVAFCLGIAALIDGVFLFTHEYFGVSIIIITSYEFVGLGSYLSFSLNAISNYYLLKFAREIYGEQVKRGVFLVLSIIQLAVIPFLFINYFIGPFLYGASILKDIIDLTPLVAHILCSIVIYMVFSVNAFKIRRVMPLESDQDYIIRKALVNLGLTGIFMLLAVLSFVTHEVFVNLDFLPDFLAKEAVSIALGWIFGAIAAFFMYSGYVSPELMKR